MKGLSVLTTPNKLVIFSEKAFLPSFAYMDVGKGREQDAEALWLWTKEGRMQAKRCETALNNKPKY
ncbi:hypothetical protein [Aliikangiella coralliicola]|uniref:Uncharacterized protein n=1 Tax=Aliikangiella coralliicola TaxID=2592383 RepID=A0A545UG37_9GAMM|nr:hypothetical protein [Aliikangiella coralliicola]TQV88363.1 hypothetical protein FLL46_07505 [Aliikangiella coralliicola]